jgi:hypothetical protein
MERKRIYITVKTYPTLSEKFAELVCTAGISEDGSWIRLYPLPFRKLDNDQEERKRILFKSEKVYTNLEELINLAKAPPYRSLAIFKPIKIIDFYSEPTERDWP